MGRLIDAGGLYRQHGLWIILGVANGGFVLYGPVAMPLAYTAFMVVGALIVAHRPGNAMGWLFSALGLLAAIMFLALEYAKFAYYTRPGPWPGAIVAAWLSAWAVIPLSGLTVTFTLLLFPSGRLLSPRWRVVAWLAAMDLAAVTAVAALGPTLPTVGVPNPIGVAGMPDLQQGAVGNALRLLGYALPLAACASLVVRFRRSQEWSASSSSGSRTLLCCWSPLHRRYNAARTVEGFSGRLRDEIDLDTLSAELLAVVDQTMQPTAVSLWLRPSVQTLSRTEG